MDTSEQVDVQSEVEAASVVEEAPKPKPKRKRARRKTTKRAPRRTVATVIKEVFNPAPASVHQEIIDGFASHGVTTIEALRNADPQVGNDLIRQAFYNYGVSIVGQSVDLDSAIENGIRDVADSWNMDYNSLVSYAGLGELARVLQKVSGNYSTNQIKSFIDNFKKGEE